MQGSQPSYVEEGSTRPKQGTLLFPKSSKLCLKASLANQNLSINSNEYSFVSEICQETFDVFFTYVTLDTNFSSGGKDLYIIV